MQIHQTERSKMPCGLQAPRKEVMQSHYVLCSPYATRNSCPQSPMLHMQTMCICIKRQMAYACRGKSASLTHLTTKNITVAKVMLPCLREPGWQKGNNSAVQYAASTSPKYYQERTYSPWWMITAPQENSSRNYQKRCPGHNPPLSRKVARQKDHCTACTWYPTGDRCSSLHCQAAPACPYFK